MSANDRLPSELDEYPQLRQFSSGYLHQDFAAEHGTPENARAAFLADASDAERQGFLDESARFLAATADRPWADVRVSWAALGAAWRPSSRAILRALLEGDKSFGRPAGHSRRRQS